MSAADSFTEDVLEKACIEICQELGYEYQSGPDIACDGRSPERDDYKGVLLENRLRDALFRINPEIPREALDDAWRQVITFNNPSLAENNHYFHQLLTEGIEVSFKEHGLIRTKRVYLIDVAQPERNDFLVVNQFTILGLEKRRPDLILFINGLPLVVVELKSASDDNVGIENAYNQIQTYKKDIEDLFNYNAFCIISDGINARAGTITSNLERFMNWRSTDGQHVEPLSVPQYETLFRGMLSPSRLLDIITHFILFQTSSSENYDRSGKKLGAKKSLIKILAAYHQYFAVKKAIEKTKIATSATGNRKIGVVWHTQGSGKSFTMVFYAAALVRQLNNPTIVVITDRNDLDDQLYTTFAKSQEILRQEPRQANVRKLSEEQKKAQTGENTHEVNGLYDLLNDRVSGGIIFTTIQKFKPEDGGMPVLTDRRNVIIIADEAHRSQYGLEAKTNLKTGNVKFGYAKYMRDALPNASYIGFTGTPIEFEDKSTPAVFGNYIDIYDMTRSVEDKATVKIYYENRIIKLDANDDVLKSLDDEFDEITEGQEEVERERIKAKWSRLEAVVGSPNRIRKLAADIVQHFEAKEKEMAGKAMIVCMSRRICVDLYDAIVRLRPDWHSDDVDKGKIKVVMTGSAADNERLQKHVGGKQRRDILAKRMKDVNDPLKIVIVRDMWLTGFDVPSLNTMYIDKPMKGHNLMQAIARVNRVFKDKEGGVVVDYIGILESLKKALNQYTDSDRKNTGIDTSAAIAVMEEKFEIVKGMFHGFDYSGYFEKSPVKRLRAITGGMDFILGKGDKDQKDYIQFATELGKAHGLCAATEQGKAIALEVGFFKAVKASLVKLKHRDTSDLAKKTIEQRVSQMLERSIISEDVIDVFDTLGLKQPEISLLDEQFLQEVKTMKTRNLAREMLKKLLEGEIKTMGRTNLVKSELFSEKLRRSLNKYRNQSITNAEVIEELIRMANEIRQMGADEAKLGLNRDEIAFYYALSKDQVVRKFYTDDTLKKIAQELTNTIRKNVTIDFNIREQAQAMMRIHIRRLLKKYHYPPEQAKTALDTVMKQVNLMSSNEAPDAETYDGMLGAQTAAEDKGKYRI
ncbi:type I restriction endonuclease subunit R [Sporolactobacillus sp. THM19-2]|uniref:type I restriction endonuclease subunit R n=1 Tax=Sporolactobacillus sp. THM19-2 TaxID=2511171 RepID=UPI0010220FA4|nr:type I restriction endonuclease subunit R [Sporolactobacillus sp. THM19-2]RYL92407.1 type I restriction endonuclease subunit R [Sporolactobacillus sp. THM19-2]